MTTGLLFRIWISPARLALSGRLRQVAADEIGGLIASSKAWEASRQLETARAKARQNPLASAIGGVRSLARA